MSCYNYTFIIPHKDIPELLFRCIESIPKRSDIQIIVVDDNSSSANFITIKNKLGKFVEVYNSHGSGAGAARNLGLNKACGKWIIFADADDSYDNSFINIMDDYLDSPNDIIYFNANRIDNDSNVILQDKYYDDEELIIENFWVKRYTPWAKMFSKKFLDEKRIYFEEIIASNDIMFSLKTGYYANKIKRDDRIVYHKYYRKRSLTSEISYDNAVARLLAAYRFNSFCNEHSIKDGYISNFGFVVKYYFQTHDVKSFYKLLNLFLKINPDLYEIWKEIDTYSISRLEKGEE